MNSKSNQNEWWRYVKNDELTTPSAVVIFFVLIGVEVKSEVMSSWSVFSKYLSRLK